MGSMLGAIAGRFLRNVRRWRGLIYAMALGAFVRGGMPGLARFMAGFFINDALKAGIGLQLRMQRTDAHFRFRDMLNRRHLLLGATHLFNDSGLIDGIFELFAGFGSLI